MQTDEQFSRLAALAASQHAVASRRQASALGITKAVLRNRESRGQVIFVGPHVLRFPGIAPTWKQELMIGVLDAGSSAAAGFEASAALAAVPGFWPGPVDVIRLRGSQRGIPVLGELHETRYLPASHLTVIDGIPATRLPRTLFDLAGAPGIHPKRLERALNSTITRVPTILDELRHMLLELGRRGRPGIGLMRELLDGMPPGYVPPATGLEMDALALVAEVGIKVRRQVNLGSYTEWIGRTDAKVVELPLIIEVDSIVHHMSPMDQARDAARDAEFREAGLEVVRVFDVEVYRMPWTVGPKVLEACACVRRGEPVPKRGVPTLLFSPNSLGAGLGVGQEPLPGRTR